MSIIRPPPVSIPLTLPWSGDHCPTLHFHKVNSLSCHMRQRSCSSLCLALVNRASTGSTHITTNDRISFILWPNSISMCRWWTLPKVHAKGLWLVGQTMPEFQKLLAPQVNGSFHSIYPWTSQSTFIETPENRHPSPPYDATSKIMQSEITGLGLGNPIFGSDLELFFLCNLRGLGWFTALVAISSSQ